MTRQKNNQLLLSVKTTFLAMTMLIGVFFIGATTASATSVSLRPVLVPSGGTRLSRNFRVYNRGVFTVIVKVKTRTVAGYGGQSRYKIELMRGNAILSRKTKLVSSSYESVSFTYIVRNCNTRVPYRFRVTNTSRDNPQQGVAIFPTFQVPSLTRRSGYLSRFGVTQGNTTNRPIPQTLRPSGTGGTLKITATWDGNCLPDVKGCKLPLHRGYLHIMVSYYQSECSLIEFDRSTDHKTNVY